MLILSPEEQATWFPGITAKEGALLALLVRAQTFAEGKLGANRLLSMTDYEQIVTPLCGAVYLSMWPIVEITSVEGRRGQSHHDGWGRPTVNCTWQPVTGFTQEPPNKICLPGVFATDGYSEIRVQYSAGWDFSETDINQLGEVQLKAKAGLAEILLYQETPQFCGLVEDSGAGVKFNSSGPPAGSLPDGLYLPFLALRALC